MLVYCMCTYMSSAQSLCPSLARRTCIVSHGAALHLTMCVSISTHTHHATPNIRWCIAHRGVPFGDLTEGPLGYFLFALTLVVVAVPEGLPLAVTMSLAFNIRRMLRANVCVFLYGSVCVFVWESVCVCMAECMFLYGRVCVCVKLNVNECVFVHVYTEECCWYVVQ